MKIAIITARGGSKRIPKKNIKEFCGKPIISYSIEAALASKLFDEVMVSTDSKEIMEISRQYGARVPFMRSEENSNDYAGTEDVIKEVLIKYEERGTFFSEYCCIYPTAPFITADKLIESHKLLDKPEVYNVIPMVAFSFPPQRGMIMQDGYLQPYQPEFINKRSQDLDTIFHDCGQFYWGRVSEFKKNADFLQNHTVPYFVNEMEVQDIDNEVDWEIAEMKYRIMNLKNK